MKNSNPEPPPIPIIDQNKPLAEQPEFAHLKKDDQLSKAYNSEKVFVGWTTKEHIEAHNERTHAWALRDNLENILAKIEEKGIEGDIVELGVFKGKNTKIIGSILKEINPARRYHGFDTFNGYTQEDLDKQPNYCNLEGLIENNETQRWNFDHKILVNELEENGLSDICKVYPGDLKENLKLNIENNTIEKIAILFVDCNAYFPSFVGMNLAYQIMDTGSFIFIDEHSSGGETRALQDFATQEKLTVYSTNIDHYRHGPSMWCMA